jgi:DNA-3-methyladenine glycosylase I
MPLHDDRRLFEMLVLEGAQARMAWITILRKREGYREAFDGFTPAIVARYDNRRVARLLKNEKIVRNRLKIESTITNARAFLQVLVEHGSFDACLWQFIDSHPKRNRWTDIATIPTETVESRSMSNDLKRRDFRFVGPTICYALMQATGMVNDHLTSCFRYDELTRKDGRPKERQPRP